LRRGKANAEQSRRPPFSLRGNCSPLTPSGLGGGKSGAFQAGIAQGEKLALKILRARFSCIIERVGAIPLATNECADQMQSPPPTTVSRSRHLEMR